MRLLGPVTVGVSSHSREVMRDSRNRIGFLPSTHSTSNMHASTSPAIDILITHDQITDREVLTHSIHRQKPMRVSFGFFISLWTWRVMYQV